MDYTNKPKNFSHFIDSIYNAITLSFRKRENDPFFRTVAVWQSRSWCKLLVNVHIPLGGSYTSFEFNELMVVSPIAPVTKTFPSGNKFAVGQHHVWCTSLVCRIILRKNILGYTVKVKPKHSVSMFPNETKYFGCIEVKSLFNACAVLYRLINVSGYFGR